jgi:hypothetical protein
MATLKLSWPVGFQLKGSWEFDTEDLRCEDLRALERGRIIRDFVSPFAVGAIAFRALSYQLSGAYRLCLVGEGGKNCDPAGRFTGLVFGSHYTNCTLIR